jgi:hypothetical protein
VKSNLTFDLPARGFTLTNAASCAEASRLAYSAPSTIETAINHILVLECEEATVIAFRGTENLRDALTDGECWKASHLHAGFSLAFDSTAGELTEHLAKLPPDKPLFFTGHSLGGAQAILAATFFFHRTTQVYTFGQPRVGDGTYAAMVTERLKGRYFRLVNQEDIVPWLPLYTKGFRHAGQEVWFPSIGGMYFGAPLWLKLLSDLYGTWLDYKKDAVAQLEDHAMSRYIERLQSVE